MAKHRFGEPRAVCDPALSPPLVLNRRLEIGRRNKSLFSHEDILSSREDLVKHSVPMTSHDFGRWLAKQLDRRDWKQADLVERGRFSRTAVSNWINGHRLPDPKSCDLIADVLNVDRDLVLALAGHRSPEVELAPDDPATTIISMVRRVDWSDPLWVNQITNMLELFIEHGKRAKEEG